MSTITDGFVANLSQLAYDSCGNASAATTTASGSLSPPMRMDESKDNYDAANGEPRSYEYLHSHSSGYKVRIESILSYLESHRFGRLNEDNGANAQLASLQRTPHEWSEDVKSLEHEWATWILLANLREADDASRVSAPQPELNERYSSQLLEDRFKATPPVLASNSPSASAASAHVNFIMRTLKILDWLQYLSEFTLRIEQGGVVNYRSTLRRLQRSTAGDAQRDFIDPDVELRLKANGILPANGSVIEKQDSEEESRLLDYVWQLIRAGQLTQAIELCRTYKQNWRAASLQGGERIHDEGQVQADGSVFRVGNPTRLLWRYTCRRLSTAAGVSPVEASIYGLLGGDLPSALKYSGQYRYEEALYCYLKILADEQIEEWIRKENKQEAMASRVPRAERTVNPDTTLNTILSMLESPNPLLTPAVATQAQSNPYIRLQKWLLLDDIDSADKEMAHTIRTQYRSRSATSKDADSMSLSATTPSPSTSTINHTYLLFAFHIYLYLHPRCPTSEPLNESGVEILEALLGYLESTPYNHPLIARYASFLLPHQRVSFYIRFLKTIPSLSARQKLLAELSVYNPENSLEITTGLVQNIIGDETASATAAAMDTTTSKPLLALPAPTAATTSAGFLPSLPTATGPTTVSTVPNILSTSLAASQVSQSDMEKILSVDCFVLSGPNVNIDVVQEALIQAIQLYRTFISREKYNAAKQFAQHLQTNAWEHAIFNIMQQYVIKQQTLPALWSSLDREYSHWRLYIKCLNWYDTWMTCQSIKPKRPTFSPNQFTNAATARSEFNKNFEKKYQTYLKEIEEWNQYLANTVKSTMTTFFELLEVEGGFLNPFDPQGANPASAVLRANEVIELRKQIIPKLVQMAIQVAKESQQEDLCLSVADVLVSPSNNLSTCFTRDQLCDVLKQFRDAYVRTTMDTLQEE